MMMIRFIAVLPAISLLLANGTAQQTSRSGNEIHQLVLGDAADRGVVQPGGPQHKELTADQVRANDAARRKRVHEMLEQNVLQTGADFFDAAIIFQHGDNADDYLLAHVLAMVAVAKGDPGGREIAAATLDRYLQFIGQAQVFGTQSVTRGYMEYLAQQRTQERTCGAPAKDNSGAKPTAVKEEDAKKWTEWVQAPYNTSLISDSLRAQYCVASLEEQKKNLDAMNAGKSATQKPIPGCPQ